MSSILPSGFDPQASLDAALFGAGGSSIASSDPAVAALEALGGSYGDEIASLQQELQPATGATNASGSPTADFESAMSALLGGGAYGAGGSLLGAGPSLVDLLG